MRRGNVFLTKIEEAKYDLMKLVTIEPNNKDILNALKELKEVLSKNEDKEKQFCQKMFNAKKLIDKDMETNLPSPLSTKKKENVLSKISKYVFGKCFKKTPKEKIE